jgi:predicted porin
MRLKMKPAVLAFMASSALPASSQTAGTAEIYGRLNVALEHVNVGPADSARPATDLNREVNNRSVLGFRGSEGLGHGARLIWQVEGTLAPDTGVGSIAARDTRIGIATPYGTIFGGNWGTPYTLSTQGFDPYYPTTAGYMDIMGNGSASTADNISDKTSFDRRQQNSVHFWSPTWNGATLRIAHGMNEERAGNARPSLTSASVVYEKGSLYLTGAYEMHHEYQGAGLKDDAGKLGAAYQFGSTRIAVAVEKIRYRAPLGTLERKSWYASLTHSAGPHGMRAAVARAADGEGSFAGEFGGVRAGADTGALHYTLGYDYALSRRSNVYVYFTRLKNERRAVYDFALNQAGSSAGATLSATALGIRHSF